MEWFFCIRSYFSLPGWAGSYSFGYLNTRRIKSRVGASQCWSDCDPYLTSKRYKWITLWWNLVFCCCSWVIYSPPKNEKTLPGEISEHYPFQVCKIWMSKWNPLKPWLSLFQLPGQVTKSLSHYHLLSSNANIQALQNFQKTL